MSGAPVGDALSDFKEIKYKVRVKDGVLAGTVFNNCFRIDGQGPNIDPRRTTTGGGGAENENLSPYIEQSCSSNLTVLTLATVSSRKGIKGECDEDFVYFNPDGSLPPDLVNLNGIGRTFPGGEARYRLEIKNPGNITIRDMVVVDILPYIGDMGVLRIDENRLTQWRPTLAGPITAPAGVTVYYSIEQNPCRPEFVPAINPAGCTGPSWSTTPPSDISLVQAVKLVFTSLNIGPAETFAIEWDMYAPFDAPQDLIAWNSYAFQGTRVDNNNRFLTAEPNKVGLAVKRDPKSQLGNYVWVDRNQNGLQDEPPGDGVNGIRVILVKSTDNIKGNGDDMRIDTTYTVNDFSGDPGYYLFPGLDAGRYYVIFDLTTLPPTTAVTIQNAGNDALDSDADPVMGMTDLVNLGLPEENLTLDMGITPPDCILDGTRVVPICNDNGTPNNLNDDQITLQQITAYRSGSAGGSQYTLIIERCVPNLPTDQLVVMTNLNYGQTYGPFGPFAVAEGEEIKITVVDQTNPLCRIVDRVLGCSDYGDLPDSYGTTGPDAPQHLVQQDKMLGTCVDTELDGQPSAEANGDNDSDGLRTEGTCGPNGDEDGIEFLTPLVPGDTACIRVSYISPASGDPLKLNGFIDFNGDGDFDVNPGNLAGDDQLDFFVKGTVGPASLNAMLPLGQGEIILCFLVPSDATFVDGDVFARFRLSCDGDLGPEGINADGSVPPGEIEDYFFPTVKVGNLVWRDQNNNGRQDASETGIGGVEMTLLHAGEDETFGTSDDFVTVTATDANGVYYFCGLIENDTSMYKIIANTPDGFLPAIPNNLGVSDILDSDGTPLVDPNPDPVQVMFLLDDLDNLPTEENGKEDEGADGVNDYPDDRVDETFDFGLLELDLGDLPGPNYPTVLAQNAARHSQPEVPKTFLGNTVDTERNGQPDGDAGEVDGGDSGDEDGVIKPAMFFPGEEARFIVKVTNTNTERPTSYIYGFVDWDNSGTFDGGDEVATATVNGSGMIDLVFTVPFDAAVYSPVGARFRIGTVQAEVSSPTGFATDGEVEDYLITELKGLDFGDAGETFPTTIADDGPRHGVPSTPNLYLGPTEDIESNGQPDDDAGETGGGDDGNGDDEDGVRMLDASGRPTMLITCLETTMRIDAVIPAGQTPFLQGWIDFNDNGNWDDPGEQVAKDFALTSGTGAYYLTFTVPCDAKVTSRTFLRFRISTEEGLGYTGFTMDGEVEDYVEAIKGLDFGDLPTKPNSNDFPTTLEDNGPRHVLDPTAPGLYLGAGVDTDPSGTPSDKADSDDTDGNDDEDGIRFITPLMPGEQACVEVTVANATNSPAYLYAYMDYDGDCELAPIFSRIIPPGGLIDTICFTVPDDESSSMGMAYFRFRLGTNQDEVDQPTGLAMDGEVEDYKLNLAKVGNIVWFDRNADGIQNESEKDYGINGVMVSLIYAGANGTIQTTDPASPQGDDAVYATVTATLDENGDPLIGAPGPDDKRGEYYFCGLIEGTYRIVAMNPANMLATTANAGLEDDRDSDGSMIQINNQDKTVIDFQIEDVISNPEGEEGIEDQELAEGFPTNEVKTYPDNQVDQTFDVGFTSRDFGDLPEMGQGEMFPTTIANNGAMHTVPNPSLTPEIPNLYLGARVDTEPNGQPAAMADGDDANTDDEDGIRIVSPLVPGYEACVEVTSTIPANTIGYLQGWIDFNGNGKIDDSEQAVKDYVLLSGNNVLTTVCFEVPEDAMFNEGMAFMRWRLSTEQGLGFTGQALDGEVEDYKRQLAKLGNLVWEDTNFNGRQDNGENGIEGVPVQLVWAGPDGNVSSASDNEVFDTVTDENGEYYFCGLIEGNYKLIVQTPEDMTPTRPDVASVTDSLDSDGEVMLSPVMDLSMVMDSFRIAVVTNLPLNEDGLQDDPNEVSGFPDNQVDQTHDFGFAGLDYGDLPEEEDGEKFNTTMAENGALHVITEDLRLGSCTDGERDGNPDDDAGAFDGKDGDQGNGDDGTPSVFKQPAGTDCDDDEDGIRFITPLIPGNPACVEVVTYNNTGETAVLQAWMDWNGNGILDASEILAFDNGGLVATGAVKDTFCFSVPFQATFNDGLLFARFRLSPDGGLGPDGPDKFGASEVPQGEVEDYMIKVAKIGNLVWEDRNYNGQQDDTEEDLGINGTVVALIFAGANGTIETSLTNPSFPLATASDDLIFYDTTATYTFKDNSTIDGLYYFCGLIEGTYDVVVLGPKDLTPTRANLITTSQDEDKDSDGLETARNLTTQRTLAHSGVFTMANQMAVMQLAEGEEGIGDQDLSNLLDVNNVGTFPDMQVDQRFDFGFIALDFGDLPQEADLTNAKFNTTIRENGPRHIVKPDFYLGSCVDAELDGTPDDQAGSSAYGASEGDDAADNDPNSWKQGAACTDDEDGIRFLTPLMPGYEACIELRYALPDNFDGPDGFLNAWIDYNGNGTLDANEKLAWTKVNNAAASVEATTGALELERIFMTNGGGKVIVCFDVPEDAAYFTGNVLSRFRLSEDPRLGPDGILPAQAGYLDGRIPCGEVEDYFMKLTKVGNLVWEDRDYDGVQDINEPVIPNVPIKLEYAGLDGVFGTGDLEFTYHDTTDASGRYYFCGLIGNVTYDPSGVAVANYRLTAEDPDDMTPTVDRTDVDERLDSDGDDTTIDDLITRITFAITNPMAQPTGELHPTGINDQGGVGTFPDMQVNETFDFGYTGFDYGDLPVAGTSYLTLRDSMSAQFSGKFGPRHAIQPKLYLGEGVDGELNGQPDADAGSKNGGDDDGASAFRKGTGTDDESGIRLLTPLIPGEIAMIKVTYTSQDTAANAGNPTATGYVNKDAYLRAYIDFNGDGILQYPTDVLTFSSIGTSQSAMGPLAATDNPVLPGGENLMRVLAFRVPTDAVYRDGTAFMRYRLSWESGLGPDNNAFHQNTAPFVNTALAYPRGEVEDYAVPVVKVGNLAWFDHDVKGDQNENDFVDTLQLVLVWGGVNENSGVFDAAGYQTTMASAGSVTDVLYNLSIVPTQPAVMPPNSNDTPGQVVRTNGMGLYSFQGLIPGNYYLIPLKYLQGDSASFVNAWPKHRVLTLKDNLTGDDINDSDGMPGATLTINDENSREPEVCASAQPTGENGKKDADDAAAMNAMHPSGKPTPDSLYNQTIDFGWVDEPNVEANLDIVGVNYPSSEICGNFNVIMHLCIKNPTEVPLDSLQAFLNLKAAYGNAFYAATKPKVSIVDSSYVVDPAGVKVRKSMLGAKTALKVNPNYNGDGTTSLLLPLEEQSGFYLPGDSIVCIRVEFEIDPSKTDKYEWSSQAYVTGRAVGFQKNGSGVYVKRPLTDYFVKSPNFGGSIIVNDLSDEIDDPMVGGDMIAFEGMVADRGYNGTYNAPFSAPNVTGRDKYLDEDDVTIQNDECWIKTQWNSGIKNINITLSPDCKALVNADMLVPNYEPGCGFDKYPEGSYYRVIIIDKHTERTLWSSAWRTPFDATPYLGRHLVYEVKSVANHCEVVWGDLNFEDKTAPVVDCPDDTDKKVGGTYTFVCTDIDSVLNVERSYTDAAYAYFTGKATATDNCGTPVMDKVTDQLTIFTDCNEQISTGYYAQIERTFFFHDEYGNVGSCKQFIYFKRPQIILPECKIEVPAHLAKGDTILTSADMVGKYGLAESVPYFYNGAGKRIYLTGKDYCGFAIDYTDENVYLTGECGRKIIRRWSILDWCYNGASNYPDYLVERTGGCYDNLSCGEKIFCWEQLIVVGDVSAPVVKTLDSDKDGYRGTGYANAPVANPYTDNLANGYDAGDYLTFSTGAMDCTGAFRFTKEHFTVDEQSKWCFDLEIIERKPILDLDKLPTGEYSFLPLAAAQISGDCDKGYFVSGIPMPKDTSTTYFAKVRVYNVCYGSTTILIPFRIVDKIAPVMKCDDKLHVTLDNYGTGKVAAKEVDEGSFDNCSKLVWMKVRRPIGACESSFLTLMQFVDANKNGKIDANVDYIDENRNRVADPLEYFRINEVGGALMSPLLDTVPIFCCDIDSVMVELWGEDKAGNRSYCWNWIKVEDKTALDYLLPFDQTYKCTEERDRIHLLSVAGTYAEGTDTYAAAIALLKGDIAVISGGFCSAVTKEIVVTPSLHCDAGEITISWKVTKATSKGTVTVTTASRTIYVQPVHEYNIMFPADIEGTCANLRDTANVIDGGELGCDVLAVNVSDKRYNGATLNGAPIAECYKIFRTFTVINWCQYDERCGEPMQWAVVVPRDPKGNGTNWNDAGGVNVLVRDANMDGTEEIWYEDENGTVAFPNDGVNWANKGPKTKSTDDVAGYDDRLGLGNLPATCQYAGYGNNGGERFAFMFTQYIFVHDNERPEVNEPGEQVYYQNKNNCSTTVAIEFSAFDVCSGNTEVQQVPAVAGNLAIERVTLNGSPLPSFLTVTPAHALNGDDKGTNAWVVTGTGDASQLPMGNHKLEVIVRDDCGNLSLKKDIPFSIVDSNGIAPICHHGLSTALMKNPDTGEGEMAVWASDFVASPVDDCNGQGPETGPTGKKLIKKYYIVKDNGDGKWDETDGLNTDGIPTEPATSVTFTCDDLAGDTINTVMIRLYTVDEKGNWAWCETYTVVTDPRGVCGGPVVGSTAIAGAITTETKVNVEGVEVNLSGEATSMHMTGANGQYLFNGLEKGYDYSVTPHLDKDYLNGVSTFDLVLITKHILGVQPLNTPYKLIAADINNSKTVTTLDLIQLRKLILGIDAKYANNTSWRFVDGSFKFANPANPWQTQFPEVVNINDLSGEVNANFIAVKVGDVNGNALANSLARTAGSFSLRTDDVQMKAGNEYRIAFTGDLSAIEGYQFTLGFDRNAVELADVEYGVAKAENFGIFAKEGLITASWNEAQGAGRTSQGETLFTLVVKAKADVASLREVLNINSRITRAEAYRTGGDYLSVSLAFTHQRLDASAPFALLQNVPNPFEGETLIGFNLPEAGEATLTIQDIKGSTIWTYKGEFTRGYNAIRIKDSDLQQGSGMFYYTLRTSNHTATKKMIMVSSR
ncbi:MAG: hypothetical protein KIPDCIKN_01704 [Haliscomenobacter sp.]|nr:hypothetical protein [Haliscomenobacter sp.]